MSWWPWSWTAACASTGAGEGKAILPELITRAVGWATAIYFRVERRGPPLPDGPVLVVANHPNALLDPLVLFRIAGRPTRPLAKAPLFEQALVGTALRGLGGLPVYRRRDDPAQMHRNEATFDAAVEALHQGDAIQIYPEGQSHSEPSLTPLKTGAARIAFLAEARARWQLGLRIVPVGLTYQRKSRFRGCVVATVGETLTLEGYRVPYERDPETAVRLLTAELTRLLSTVTLNTERAADRTLIEAAEALYASETGLAPPAGRPSLGHRLPRLQAFAHGLALLRARDPVEVERLARAVERYRRIRLLLGAEEVEVPHRYRVRRVLVHLVRVGGPLLLLLPPAALATPAWAVPYYLPRLVVRVVRPSDDAVSTYKLGTALLTFPLMLAVWTGLAWWWGGGRWALAAALGLPVAGLAWLLWRERWSELRNDVRIFLRAAPRRKLRERLAAMRRELVKDLDRVAADLPDDPAPAGSPAMGSTTRFT